MFLSGKPQSIIDDVGESQYRAHFGYLAGPRSWMQPVPGVPWAADNDAFSTWNRDKFVAMLRGISKYPDCLFVVSPDVWPDARATIKRFI